MALMRYEEFRGELSRLLIAFGHEGQGRAADDGMSSNRVPKATVTDRANADYDLVGYVDKDWDSARKAAYLAAYVGAFGAHFPSTSLRFVDGSILPDLAIMKTMLRYRCVELVDDTFVLTEKGRALVAPFVHVDDKAMDPR